MPRAITIDIEAAQEHFFAMGWTDGLPVVPPSTDRVHKMLEGGWVDGEQVIGTVPERDRAVTTHLAAVNAVMAGCRPEYFPFVIAGIQAMLSPDFNPNAAITSTGGSALCLVVSGPGAAAIGMNGGGNALGSGNRANATIGRALRLVAANVLDARPGVLDLSSLGHPGKYSFCFAESEPPSCWPPLRVDHGFEHDDTTITLLASEGPHQVANHLSENGEELCLTFAAAARMMATSSVGKGMQGIAVIGPEHSQAMVATGMSKEDVRNRIAAASRIHPDELMAAGVHLDIDQHRISPGDDGLLPTFRDPGDLFVTTAGGPGAGWSAYIPAWAPRKTSRSTTRRVRLDGDDLNQCGPGGCELPSEFFSMRIGEQ